MTTRRVFPHDTQWAIAGQVPVSALNDLAKRLPSWLQGAGSKVIVGSGGFSALLVFGGSVEDGDALAADLSRDAKAPVFLLDFDDEAPAIQEIDGKRTKRGRAHPAEFLEDRGIVAPGYDPGPSPVEAVGLVEGTTPSEARKVEPQAGAQYLAHPRGVLVVDDGTGMMTGTIARTLKKRAFQLYWDRNERRFWCNVHEPGHPVASFSPDRPNPNRAPIQSVLGETTLDGILRVLHIPRSYLFPEER